MFPNSATYQPPSYNTKANRLYHQLLQSNYLSDHLYNPATSKSSPAAIKFVANNHLNKYQSQAIESNLKEDMMLKSPRYGSSFRTSDGTKNSHQITQSFPSNYSIVEIENQSYSTINLYNLSRNNIQHDLSASSSNITAKLHYENSHLYVPEESKPSEMLLQGSANRDQPTLQQISCLESQERVRKYRSQDYSGGISKQIVNQQQNEEIDSPLPKLLANKYIKNDISRKFSNSNNGQVEPETFKAVLNQIHVVPYKINHEVQPYAFSVPADDKKGNDTEKRGKANSLNLQNSRYVNEKEEESKNKALYFSNHPHHNNYESARHQSHIMLNNTPGSPQFSRTRPVPKSEPKIHHVSNQKTARSNSIECKAKPIISLSKKQNAFQNKNPERLQQSKVQRVYGHQQLGLKNMSAQNQSVVYDQTEVNLCCGMVRQQKQTNANRIIFKQRVEPKSINNEEGQSEDATNLNKSKRGTFYKINPVHVIKSYNESRESQSQKKGIKLVGFNSSFPKKE